MQKTQNHKKHIFINKSVKAQRCPNIDSYMKHFSMHRNTHFICRKEVYFTGMSPSFLDHITSAISAHRSGQTKNRHCGDNAFDERRGKTRIQNATKIGHRTGRNWAKGIPKGKRFECTAIAISIHSIRGAHTFHTKDKGRDLHHLARFTSSATSQWKWKKNPPTSTKVPKHLQLKSIIKSRERERR